MTDWLCIYLAQFYFIPNQIEWLEPLFQHTNFRTKEFVVKSGIKVTTSLATGRIIMIDRLHYVNWLWALKVLLILNNITLLFHRQWTINALIALLPRGAFGGIGEEIWANVIKRSMTNSWLIWVSNKVVSTHKCGQIKHPEAWNKEKSKS